MSGTILKDRCRLSKIHADFTLVDYCNFNAPPPPPKKKKKKKVMVTILKDEVLLVSNPKYGSFTKRQYGS